MMTNQIAEPKVHLNHIIIRLGDGSAVMAVESSLDLNPNKPPAIHRFYREPNVFSPMNEGRVIGHGLRDRCAMLVKVAPYSLISVAEPLRYGEGVRWSFYQLGADLQLTVVESGSKLAYDEIHRAHRVFPEHQSASLVLSDHDLTEVFRSSQPDWFRRIAEAQMEHWRTQKTECYARIAPTFPASRDISRCIEAEPYTMLARWRHLMDSDQLRRCAELSPEGAVRFAFDHIPPDRRDEYLNEHAMVALTHSFNQLTGPDLAVCAEVKPDLLYEKRGSLTPELQAHVLAIAYQSLWPSLLGPPPIQVRDELVQSLMNYPRVWLSLHHWSFEEIFSELQVRASIRADWGEIKNLIHHANPEVRHAILNFIASQV